MSAAHHPGQVPIGIACPDPWLPPNTLKIDDSPWQKNSSPVTMRNSESTGPEYRSNFMQSPLDSRGGRRTGFTHRSEGHGGILENAPVRRRLKNVEPAPVVKSDINQRGKTWKRTDPRRCHNRCMVLPLTTDPAVPRRDPKPCGRTTTARTGAKGAQPGDIFAGYDRCYDREPRGSPGTNSPSNKSRTATTRILSGVPIVNISTVTTVSPLMRPPALTRPALLYLPLSA